MVKISCGALTQSHEACSRIQFISETSQMNAHKTMILVNPQADHGHTLRKLELLRPMVEEFGGADWSSTTHPMHAAEIAREAAEAGTNLLIIAGGDGTIHEVVNGLMEVPVEARPKLGILPIGSGNDFAHSLGIRGDSIELLKKIYTGTPKRIDVGAYKVSDGKQMYFSNTFGIGFDATVTIRTLKLTFLRGFIMYFVAVLQTILLNLDAPQMQITADGKSWEEETIMLVACNGGREGGGFAVAPEAEFSDGLLDYASVCRVSRVMMLRLIPEVMNGTHGRFHQVRLGKFRRLDVHSQHPINIHADGEVLYGFGTNVTDVSIEVVPQAIEIIV